MIRIMDSRVPFSDRPIDHDDQFFNQEPVIKKIRQSLKQGKFCAIIGGYGMGRTSILKHFERKFSQKIDRASTSPTFIPVYFQPNLRKAEYITHIYQQLIDQTISQTYIWLKKCLDNTPEMLLEDLRYLNVLERPWPTPLDKDYEEKASELFNRYLWEIIVTIRPVITHFKFLFLFDEIYDIKNKATRETVARHCFEWLDEGNPHTARLRSHIALIITCLYPSLKQFVSHRPNEALPKSLRKIYLCAFKRPCVLQIIEEPFKKIYGDELDPNLADQIYSIVGGHPLVLQKVMIELWDEAQEGTINVEQVRQYIPESITQYNEIYGRIDHMIHENKMVAPVLALFSKGEELERTVIFRTLGGKPIGGRWRHQLREALKILTTFGVIHEVRTNTYQINGQLCWKWFQPFFNENHESTTGEKMTKLSHNDRRRLSDELNQLPDWVDGDKIGEKGVLREAGLPHSWINRLRLTGTPITDATTVITSLESLGHLIQRPTYLALGALVEYLLNETIHVEGKSFLANLIDHYQLITNLDYLVQLRQKYALLRRPPSGSLLDLGWQIKQPDFVWQGPTSPRELEAIWSKKAPFLDAVFLEKGAKVARSVCRVEVEDVNETGYGTGFLIAPNLVLTNDHVVPTDEKAKSTQVRFGYRIDRSGQLQQGEIYQVKQALRRSPIEELDYVVLELEDSPGAKDEIGYLKRVAATLKKNQSAYIIQHPNAEPQKVVLQENWITYVAHDQRRVQYLTNTKRGSSGSPVCNQKWEVVALHHSGAPIPSSVSNIFVSGNEGIPMAAIWPEIEDLLP